MFVSVVFINVWKCKLRKKVLKRRYFLSIHFISNHHQTNKHLKVIFILTYKQLIKPGMNTIDLTKKQESEFFGILFLRSSRVYQLVGTVELLRTVVYMYCDLQRFLFRVFLTFTLIFKNFQLLSLSFRTYYFPI